MLQCAVPLLFETADPVYGLSMGGSGFLATSEGRLFLITTKHGLFGSDGNPERLPRVVVACCYNSKDMWLPLDAFVLEPNDAEHQELGDVGVVALGRGWKLCGCPNCPEPYDLDTHKLPPTVPRDNTIFVRGFPHIASEINYERRQARFDAFDFRGSLVGPTARESILEVSLEGELPHLAGVSGAPVFLQHDGSLHLLGMMQRGTAVSRRGYCISAGELTIAVRRIGEEYGAARTKET